ncbi:MAG: phospholipid carrier-dependent glycosyltransferase, partial [Coleofasciculaceae cyanobacterium RL_1_1]|nr:phospholipid carrier-dependent glycosyltransferase [Coleofasciculaceae cyanobacterium RL_1_1]
AAAFTGQPTLAGDFVATYQYPDPDLPWSETINALATHPEHSPLYYVGVRLWCAIVPHTVGFIRQLSAWIGVLVLPLTYWLARELFEQPRVAQIATGLAAISPVYVHYAQEAREYSLWPVAILFGSAALLRAIGPHRPTLRPAHWTSRWPWWLAYAAGVALLLYAHPFSAFVLLAHGIYVLLIAQIRHQLQPLGAYLAASTLGVLAFTPWLWVVWQNFSDFSKIPSTPHSRWKYHFPSIGA